MDSTWTLQYCFSREFTGLHRNFVIFYYTEFTRVSVDYMWTPQGLHVDLMIFYTREFTGLHRDFVIFYDAEFTGVSVDSMWTPQRLCDILY